MLVLQMHLLVLVLLVMIMMLMLMLMLMLLLMLMLQHQQRGAHLLIGIKLISLLRSHRLLCYLRSGLARVLPQLKVLRVHRVDVGHGRVALARWRA